MPIKASYKRKVTHLALFVASVVAGTTMVATAPVYADSASDDTQANVVVTGAITLTGLTNAFTLSGTPGTVATNVGAVEMHVTTNSFAGYAVTVEPLTDSLTGVTAGNTDTIPTNALNVERTGVGPYVPLSFGTPVEVFRKTSASAPGGDTISNDYKITIPFVQPDTYTGTLEYVATTL
jgi:hypothetical protein